MRPARSPPARQSRVPNFPSPRRARSSPAPAPPRADGGRRGSVRSARPRRRVHSHGARTAPPRRLQAGSRSDAPPASGKRLRRPPGCEDPGSPAGNAANGGDPHGAPDTARRRTHTRTGLRCQYGCRACAEALGAGPARRGSAPGAGPAGRGSAPGAGPGRVSKGHKFSVCLARCRPFIPPFLSISLHRACCCCVHICASQASIDGAHTTGGIFPLNSQVKAPSYNMHAMSFLPPPAPPRLPFPCYSDPGAQTLSCDT